MKARLLFIVAVIFFTFLSGTGLANRNSGRSAASSRTRGGLVRSPNPIDTSGNLLITGNVGGGKHFRGIVPYRSASDFGAAVGSSSLDSFLRRSSGSEDFGRYTTRYKPYYSTTGTVTTTRPGVSGAIRPPVTKIDSVGGDGFDLLSLSREKPLSGLDVAEAVSNIRFRVPPPQNIAFGLPRPMSMSPQELEKALSRQMGTAPETTEQSSFGEGEQFRHDLKQLSDKAAVREDSRGELKQGLIIQDDSLRQSTKVEYGEGVRQRFEMQTPKESSTGGSEDKQPDVYEQMKQQVEGFGKSFVRQDSPREHPVLHSSFATEGRLVVARVTKEGVIRYPQDALRQDSRGEAEEEQAEEKSLPVTAFDRNRTSGDSLLEREAMSDEQRVELAVRAKGILGEHKTFASFSNDKFNQHIRAAENYLKQGKYYLAADAYTLASIYKPGDPLAYAGKSHALFAAGEYMSSALFLARALEIFPEYARFNIDIEAMVGDRDKLESRIVDVEQWLKKNDAGELQFLLAYVYYQIDRLDRAKEAVDAAYEKMPDRPKAGRSQSRTSLWPAVIALKKAIDDAVKSYQPVRE